VSKQLDLPIPQLVVDNVLTSLGRLAAFWRAEVNPCVVGITGSNGKTTTREMVSNIVEINAPILSTSGNYNNELGLPLTLFELSPDQQFAVLELGAAKAGDISYLASICQPDIGLITNVGPAHLQGFGNEEGVARAKGELYEALPASGFAVINGDEQWSGMWREMCSAQNIITFGKTEACDVYAEQSGADVTVLTPSGSFPLQLHLPGDHNIQNALAATSVALTLDISLDQIRKGLENTSPVPGRLNLIHTRAGWTVIDDTYNANPASLYAALQVLTLQQGEAWLVLGDMKELGLGSRKMHAEMGESARALGVERVYAIGDATVFTVDAFGPGARHFSGHSALIDALRADLSPGVACLIKGSRSMGMEQVVDAVTGPFAMREAG
jgi:UDP-N-acetylmuramoyl-tripeptide--D-alanyl-D-alanine ligase